MGLSQSPSIVTNGLVLYYDMNNTQKSFKGIPIANRTLIPTPDPVTANVTFANNGTGTFKRIYSGTYGGYEIQPSDIVYRYDLGLLGCHFHGNTIATAAGRVVTFSVDYYISADVVGYPSTNYIGNMECYETVGGPYVFIAGNSFTDPTPAIKGVWKRGVISVTVPASTTPVIAGSMYPGACGDTRLATSGYILYKNPQLEENTFASPFVAGTRANTQSILDLTNRNTFTATSLTYASNNTFSFVSASGNFITLPAIAASGNAARSMFCWINVTAGGCFISTGTASSGNAFNLVNYGSGYVGVMGFNSDFYPASGTAIVNTGWKYIGATYDGAGTLRTYVNGVQDNISTGRTYNTIGQNNFAGKSHHVGSESYISGSMPVVQIYNQGLTAAEVMQNFNAQRGRYGI